LHRSQNHLPKQIEDGKYTWDTKISELFPEFKLYDSKATQKFAVRDLVAHDSGLRDHALQFLPYFGYDQNYQIRALRFLKPEAAFRTKFAYQNIFLEVAQNIIEKYSGTSYTNNLHERLLKPLDMQNSYLWTEHSGKLDNLAEPNFYYRGKLTVIPNNWLHWENGAMTSLVATAGIKSTVVDIAKWVIFHMNNGIVDGKQLIDMKDMNFMHAVHTPIKTAANGVIKEAYGEGWFVNTQENAPYTTIYHTGDYTGVKALMKYIQEAKIGIVILTNQSYNLMPEALAKRFFAMYFNKPLKDWGKINLIKRNQDEQKWLSKSPKCNFTKGNDLEKYVGTYSNNVYGKKLIVAKNGDHLSLTIGPKKIEWSLTPCKNNIFKAYWSNPGNLDFPIITGKDEVVKFISTKTTNTIRKMRINYLNHDGSGVFDRI